MDRCASCGDGPLMSAQRVWDAAGGGGGRPDGPMAAASRWTRELELGRARHVRAAGLGRRRGAGQAWDRAQAVLMQDAVCQHCWQVASAGAPPTSVQARMALLLAGGAAAQAGPAPLPRHRLVNAPAPWGESGRVLVSGLAGEDASGRVVIERCGPFAPPMTLTGQDHLVVTDDFRQQLEGSGLRGLSFREVVVQRVVLLDWQQWDRTAADPAKRPAGDQPENYVLRRKHNERAAAAVGALWELVPGADDEADVVRDGSGALLVSETARRWLATSGAADWVGVETT